MSATPDERRGARAFLIALAAYFTAQVVLRLALGGTFEADEAEMVILNRDWHLVAGSQTPLYDWWQALWFSLLGVNTAGLVVAKNLFLFATYAATFAALRGFAALGPAMLGTLSLALLPNLSWWAQRTGSHSVALALMTAVTLWAFLHLLRRGDGRAFVLFGVAVGLGAISKVNYLIVPAALILSALFQPGLRARLIDRRAVLALIPALAIPAVPYVAMLADPLPTFSDTWEFYKDAGALPWASGLLRLGLETLAGTAPLIVLLGIGLAVGLRFRPMAPEARVMIRAGAIGLLLVAALMVAANASFVRARWILPLFMLAGPALVATLYTGIGARGLRRGLIGFAVLALVLLGGIADVRLRGAGSDSLRVDLLAEVLEQELGEVPLIAAPHYYTGNLALHRPGWRFLPPYPTRDLETPPDRLLVLDANRPAQLRRRLAEHGGADLRYHILAEGVVELPYRFSKGALRPVSYSLLGFDPDS